MRRIGGVGDRVYGDVTADAGADPIWKSGARIKKSRTRGRRSGDANIDRSLAGRDGTSRRWLCRRRREKFHDLHAVGIFSVAPFLDRPHRHVVAWIDAGKRIISPPMRSVLIGAIVRVVVGAAVREN
jgi:hypothetical protein